MAGCALRQRGKADSAGLLDPNRLSKFVDQLAQPVTARSTTTRSNPFAREEQVPLYRLVARQIERKIHRDLPSTRMWGIGPSSPGVTIEARSNQPILIEWVNELPAHHFLPIDHSIHGADPSKPDVRTVFHVHGARVPPESDGYPENWFTPTHSLISVYPNRQDATTLWYHDHSIGISRLNMLAGLFGFYLIRDDVEDALNLPGGRYEIPLVLYDRSFRSDGQLYYPVSANPDRPWVPEFFGDAILANGTLFPFLDTEPRKYRFRLLNASNSRFLYLSLSNGQTLRQIGSDQGFLPTPVDMRRITLAPGERADVVIDFREARGDNVTLHSDDYAILQFRTSRQEVTDTAALPSRLRQVDRIAEAEAIATRLLTLEGGSDPDDPTTMSGPLLLNGAFWHEPVTENPRFNTAEIWSLVNVTDDSHPIHLHLVRFQILDRRAFDVFTYLNERQLRYTGPPILPEPDEAGWKDTVRAHPGMVTRIIIRFEGFAGRYVWHCHVLEHEDYEMMRPYDVLP